MAKVVTAEVSHAAGRRRVTLHAVETDIGAASEWSTADASVDVPRSGYIVLYQAQRIGGTGTTLQPSIGKAAAWTEASNDHVAEVTTPAAVISEGEPIPYSFEPGVDPILHFRTQPDAGADNDAESIVTIVDRL